MFIDWFHLHKNHLHHYDKNLLKSELLVRHFQILSSLLSLVSSSMSGRSTLPNINLCGNSSRLSTVIMFSVTFTVRSFLLRQVYRDTPVKVENSMG